VRNDACFFPWSEDRVESGIDEGGAGVTEVVTGEKRKDIRIFDDSSIIAGLCDTNGKQRVYYKIAIRKMDGVIAIGNLPLM
jgi:hypothetical protein